MTERRPRKPLATFAPDLAREWHPTRNGNLTPSDIGTGVKVKVWWKCPKGPDHEWEATVSSRKSGRGCPFCAGYAVSITNALLTVDPDVATEWHPTKNGGLTPADVVYGTPRRAWWKCPKGDDHEWEATIVSRTRLGAGCPKCRGLVASEAWNLAVSFPSLAAQWHPTKNRLTAAEVTPYSKRKAWWKCDRGPDHEWIADMGSRSAGRGCPFCAGQQVSVTNALATVRPDLLNTWHPSRNLIGPDAVTVGNSSTLVWWLCDYGHEWQAPVQVRVAGHGCPYCSGNLVSPENSVAAYPSLVIEWDAEKNAALQPVAVSRGSNQMIWWRCSVDSSHLWQAPPKSRTRGFGCPECIRPLRSSKGEMALLKRLREEFSDLEIIHHARPPWIGRMHLDIYIPDVEVAIEYQGRQHDEPVDFFGGKEAFELSRERDARKAELCARNGVHLITVVTGSPTQPVVDRIDLIRRSVA